MKNVDVRLCISLMFGQNVDKTAQLCAVLNAIYYIGSMSS